MEVDHVIKVTLTNEILKKNIGNRRKAFFS